MREQYEVKIVVIAIIEEILYHIFVAEIEKQVLTDGAEYEFGEEYGRIRQYRQEGAD